MLFLNIVREFKFSIWCKVIIIHLYNNGYYKFQSPSHSEKYMERRINEVGPYSEIGENILQVVSLVFSITLIFIINTFNFGRILILLMSFVCMLAFMGLILYMYMNSSKIGMILSCTSIFLMVPLFLFFYNGTKSIFVASVLMCFSFFPERIIRKKRRKILLSKIDVSDDLIIIDPDLKRL